VTAPLSRSSESPEVRPSQSETTLDLRTLFTRHYASVWRLLRRLGVDLAQLDDAAQEVFWVAARRLEDVQPGSEHAYLYGVALRVASNERRRSRTRAACQSSESLPALSCPKPTPEEHLVTRQARRLLEEVLAQMTYSTRAVFVLHELEGLPVKAIAELEGIPIGTVGSRLRRAREEFSEIAARLRARMRQEERR
jgi:RNA polymerase sigma-70 factor, ECF subfamily